MALTDGLLNLWNLDEESGTRFDSINTDHMTFEINSPGFAAGKIGNAIDLNGTNQAVRTNAAAPLPWASSNELTIACWLYTTSAGASEQKAFLMRATGFVVYFQLALLTSLKPRFSFTNTNGVSSMSRSDAITADAWHHMIGTYTRNDKAWVYIDDDAGQSVITGDFPLHNLDYQHAICGYSGSSSAWFEGQVDQIATWNRVLTAGERTQLYNAGDGVDLLNLGGVIPYQFIRRKRRRMSNG